MEGQAEAVIRMAREDEALEASMDAEAHTAAHALISLQDVQHHYHTVRAHGKVG